MNDKTSSIVTDELNDTLGYLIDKFNLTLEISTEQVKNFSEQLAKKIITWEIINSALTILVLTILIVIAFKLLKVLKFESTKELMKIIESNELPGQAELAVWKLIAKVAIYLCIIGIAFGVSNEIFDIVMSIAFPEKIILEFISNYI